MVRTFVLKCLGIPRLASAAGRELPFRVRKHLALLVYLAVEDQVRHRREHLVELFWPEVPERLGRQSLATALSAIRRRLGDPQALDSTPEHVRLVRGTLALDLDVLLAGKVVDEQWEPRIEVAGFLEGFELPGLQDFHHWRDRQQARLLPAIQNGLHALTDLARRSGDVTRLGRLADRLLAINELSEEGVRARMEAAAMSGDRITALRAFERHEERLRGELGATPAPILEGMAIRLRRRGWERPYNSPEPSVRTEQWQGRDFIGRAREYRALYALWEEARSAHARHMLITGESGVGKTTLADRFLTAVALEGAQVARARGYELERNLPFAMIGTILRALLDRPGVAAAAPASLAELARIVPEFSTRFPGLPPAPDAVGESARIRFAEALLDLVMALTAEHPLVLLIDDLPQVDDASLAALHFVMRRVGRQPLIVLLTSRHEPPQDAPTATRIWETAAQLSVGTLELGPMSAVESAMVLDALAMRASRGPSGVERRALIRAAGGFPLAIELLFGAWQDHGHSLSSLSLDTMTVEVGRAPEATYRRLAESSIRHLPPNQLMVLHLAAILDRRLGELRLYRLVDMGPTQVVSEMMALSARRILCDVGSRMEFVNPAIRGHLYLSIPGPLRTALHSGVADDLLTRHAAGEKIQGLEIAWHCVRADRVPEGRPYILSGAREALDQGAPHEVELALRTGMDLLEEKDHTRATLLLAEAVGEAGRWVESLEVLATRIAVATNGELTEYGALALLCRIRLGGSDWGTVEDVLGEAARIVAEAPTTQARLYAATAGAVACTHLRDTNASARFRQMLEPLLTDDLPAPTRGHLLMSLATLNAHEGRNAVALSLVEQAGGIATTHGLRSALWPRIENGMGAALCAIGRYHEAVPHFTNAVAGLLNLGNEALLRTPTNNLALCHWRLGRYEEQLACLRPVLELPDTGKPTSDLLFSHYLAGMAAALIGERETAQVHIDSMRRLFGTTTIGWLYQRAHLCVADLQILLHMRAKAFSTARAVVTGEYGRPLATQTVGAYCRWLAVLATEGLGSEQTLSSLEALAANLGTYDLVDQLEVMVGLSTLRPLREQEREQLRLLREALPRDVPDQLHLLGLRGHS
jgi:DNA-binding SARP family transcriptional activator/tetratricopeptide (TPR) repeat protein